ncbi:MAG: (4Fe-4S)-binding protein [Fimbriimonadales bacterium]
MANEYSNGEITIVWEPDKCQHSGNCVRGLPQVFDPRKRPWIEPLNASTDELIAQVEKCPSGALTWRRNA